MNQQNWIELGMAILSMVLSYFGGHYMGSNSAIVTANTNVPNAPLGPSIPVCPSGPVMYALIPAPQAPAQPATPAK